MKKLDKLLINPEKLLKDKELLFLKGGTFEWHCDVFENTTKIDHIHFSSEQGSAEGAENECEAFYGPYVANVACDCALA